MTYGKAKKEYTSSLADSRCNLHATSQSSHSRRSQVLSLVASSSVASLSSASSCNGAACRSLALASSPAFRRSCLCLPSSRHILAPRVYRVLLAQGRPSSDAHSDHLPPSHAKTSTISTVRGPDSANSVKNRNVLRWTYWATRVGSYVREAPHACRNDPQCWYHSVHVHSLSGWAITNYDS